MMIETRVARVARVARVGRNAIAVPPFRLHPSGMADRPAGIRPATSYGFLDDYGSKGIERLYI
jgi:hypothetical protein